MLNHQLVNYDLKFVHLHKIFIFYFVAKIKIKSLQKKAPIQKTPFTSPFNATVHGHICPDVHRYENLTSEELKAAEDCLHLSVYTSTVSFHFSAITKSNFKPLCYVRFSAK